MDSLFTEEEIDEGASTFIQYCLERKPYEIELKAEKAWSTLAISKLTEIGDILWSRIQVTAEELIDLKKGIFASINVDSNQRFEDEESSKVLLKTLEAQQKWFDERGMNLTLRVKQN
jgi:hypothetical protein